MLSALVNEKNGFQVPERFYAGFVLKDCLKSSWILGKPIGQGGFGQIYLGKYVFFNCSFCEN